MSLTKYSKKSNSSNSHYWLSLNEIEKNAEKLEKINAEFNADFFQNLDGLNFRDKFRKELNGIFNNLEKDLKIFVSTDKDLIFEINSDLNSLKSLVLKANKNFSWSVAKDFLAKLSAKVKSFETVIETVIKVPKKGKK